MDNPTIPSQGPEPEKPIVPPSVSEQVSMPPVNPIMSNQSGSNLKLKIALFVFVGLLVATGVMWAFRGRHTAIAPTNTPTPTISVSITPTGSSETLQGWKIYSNKEYGFEFKYPENWVATSPGAEPGTDFIYLADSKEEMAGGGISISKYHGDINDTSTFLNKDVKIINSKTVTINNISWKSFITFEDTSRMSFISYKVQTDDSIISIGFIERPGMDNLANQILSTFKFINKNAEGQFCGGIAAFQCPQGYTCKLDGDYPDAGGKCTKN